MMTNLDHLRVFGTECYVYIPKTFQKKSENKSVFGRMIGYLNDKDGYQVYMPSLNKTVHLHVVYFTPEWVCISSEIEVGLENAAVEDVAVEKRHEDDTLSDSSQLE